MRWFRAPMNDIDRRMYSRYSPTPPGSADLLKSSKSMRNPHIPREVSEQIAGGNVPGEGVRKWVRRSVVVTADALQCQVEPITDLGMHAAGLVDGHPPLAADMRLRGKHRVGAASATQVEERLHLAGWDLSHGVDETRGLRPSGVRRCAPQALDPLSPPPPL